MAGSYAATGYDENDNHYRYLNILQADLYYETTRYGQFYLFSTYLYDPKKPNFKVNRIKDCEKCTPPSKCRLQHRLEVNDVYNGNGLFLQLNKREHFTLGVGWLQSYLTQYRIITDTKWYTILRRAGFYRRWAIRMDGYQLSYFVSWCKRNPLYVEQVNNNLVCKIFLYSRIHLRHMGLFHIFSNQMKIRLVEPDSHPLSMTWSRMAIKTVNERREIQSAMAVLSTFGGALSALGEEQQSCAIAAGKISIHQLRLAFRLGDKTVVAQCRLYFALSLIQRGKTSRARHIVWEQFMNQKNLREPDVKTVNMCHGIWSRLKYERARRRALRPKGARAIRPPPVLAGLRPILGRWSMTK